MYPFLFTGLAFACAGALCAMVGDMQRRATLGPACFLAVNALIWGRFILHVFSDLEIVDAAGLFLLSQAVAACAYLAALYFLEVGGGEAAGTARAAQDRF